MNAQSGIREALEALITRTVPGSSVTPEHSLFLGRYLVGTVLQNGDIIPSDPAAQAVVFDVVCPSGNVDDLSFAARSHSRGNLEIANRSAGVTVLVTGRKPEDASPAAPRGAKIPFPRLLDEAQDIIEGDETFRTVMSAGLRFEAHSQTIYYDTELIDLGLAHTERWAPFDNDTSAPWTGWLNRQFKRFGCNSNPASFGEPLALSLLVFYAKKHSYNYIIRDIVSSMPWDGVDRISTYYRDVLGCEVEKLTPAEQEYYLAQVAEILFVGFIARQVCPQTGCKIEMVPDLRSDMGGVGKSNSVVNISVTPELYEEFTGDLSDLQKYVESTSHAGFVEFSEGITSTKASVNQLKAHISRTSVTYRAPYQKQSEQFAIRHMIIMTTNDKEVFASDDEALRRRIFPIECGRHEPAVFIDDRYYCQQLLAQAYFLWLYKYRPVIDKTGTWEIPVPKDLETLNMTVTESYLKETPKTLVSDYLDDPNNGVHDYTQDGERICKEQITTELAQKYPRKTADQIEYAWNQWIKTYRGFSKGGKAKVTIHVAGTGWKPDNCPDNTEVTASQTYVRDSRQAGAAHKAHYSKSPARAVLTRAFDIADWYNQTVRKFGFTVGGLFSHRYLTSIPPAVLGAVVDAGVLRPVKFGRVTRYKLAKDRMTPAQTARADPRTPQEFLALYREWCETTSVAPMDEIPDDLPAPMVDLLVQAGVVAEVDGRMVTAYGASTTEEEWASVVLPRAMPIPEEPAVPLVPATDSTAPAEASLATYDRLYANADDTGIAPVPLATVSPADLDAWETIGAAYSDFDTCYLCGYGDNRANTLEEIKTAMSRGAN